MLVHCKPLPENLPTFDTLMIIMSLISINTIYILRIYLIIVFSLLASYVKSIKPPYVSIFLGRVL
jgi:hypothetical protein